MEPTSVAIQQFWATCVAELPRLAATMASAGVVTTGGMDALPPPLADRYDAIATALHQIAPGVAVEIECAPTGPTAAHPGVLTITPEGRHALARTVEAIVAAAPAIAGWTVVAYRQPSPPGFVLDAFGLTYSADSVTFLLDRPDLVGCHVIHLQFPGYRRRQHDEFVELAFLLLDHVIGERAAMLRLRGVEVGPAPGDARLRGRPLTHLAAALADAAQPTSS